MSSSNGRGPIPLNAYRRERLHVVELAPIDASEERARRQREQRTMVVAGILTAAAVGLAVVVLHALLATVGVVS